MQKICIVTAEQIKEIKLLNYYFLSNALLERNMEVWIALMDSISLHDKTVFGKCIKVNSYLIEGNKFPVLDNSHFANLDQFDCIWLLSLVNRNLFLDKIEIFKTLKNIKIINSIESLLYLNSKINAIQFDGIKYPESYISSDFDFLWGVITESDSKWVVKPPASHFSKNVFFVSKEDKNTKTILQNMVGHLEIEKKYCVLQRLITDTSSSEIRVLFANGCVVGQYKKKDRFTNRYGTETHELSQEERAYCELLGNHLKNIGAFYAGVDMIYPYVIEFNILNPGGISTILEITGENISQKVISCIFP